MQYVIIILFFILSNFFGAFTIGNTILLSLLIPFLFKGIQINSIYRPYFAFLLIGILINYISCYYFRGQSFYDSFKAMSIFFYILFYFALKTLKPSLPTIEMVLLYLIITFDTIYIIQFVLLQYDINFFNIEDWCLGEDENNTRVRMISQGLYSLGIFYGINKYITTRKFIYLICISFGVIILILSSFRTFLIATILLTIFILFKLNGFGKNMFISIAIACIIFWGIANIPIVANKIDFVFSRYNDMDQTFLNEDYIRITQFRYFTQERPSNWVEYILGSGIPYTESEYGKDFDENRINGMQYVDWGLIGLSWMLGILPVLAMILYSIKVIRLDVGREYIYISVWYLYLLSTSIFEIEFYRYGNFLVQAIALYIVEIAYIEAKEKDTIYYSYN